MSTIGGEEAACDDQDSKVVLNTLLRRIGTALTDRRRRSSTRKRLRMEVESLVGTLVEELDELDCAPTVMHKIKRIQERLHLNGLTADCCQELEVFLCQLRSYEKRLRDPTADDCSTGADTLTGSDQSGED